MFATITFNPATLNSAFYKIRNVLFLRDIDLVFSNIFRASLASLRYKLNQQSSQIIVFFIRIFLAGYSNFAE